MFTLICSLDNVLIIKCYIELSGISFRDITETTHFIKQKTERLTPHFASLSCFSQASSTTVTSFTFRPTFCLTTKQLSWDVAWDKKQMEFYHKYHHFQVSLQASPRKRVHKTILEWKKYLEMGIKNLKIEWIAIATYLNFIELSFN